MNNSPKTKNKVIAVVPFYNEKETLKQLTSTLLDFVELIIFVDDCSSDHGIAEIPKNDRTIVLKNHVNSGKGFSLKKGIRKASEFGADIIITIDADLQHPPKYIPKLVNEIKNSDIVIANRINRKSMPLHRKLSNCLTSLILSRKLKVKIKDSQCGFRAFRASQLKNLSWKRDDFLAETEIIINAVTKGLTIGFVDIPTIYNNNKSKMKNFSTTLGFIKLILRNSEENKF